MNPLKDDSPALMEPALPMATINCTAKAQYDRLISRAIRGRLYWVCEYCGTTVSCLTKHAGASSVCPACKEKVVYPRPEGASEFGGIGRFKFALGFSIYFGCVAFLLERIEDSHTSGWIIGITVIACFILLMFLSYLAHERMTNTGRPGDLARKCFFLPMLTGNLLLALSGILQSTFEALAGFMGLAGIVFSVRGFICLLGLLIEQEGYIISKRLDTIGRVLVTLLISAIIVGVVLIFVKV